MNRKLFKRNTQRGVATEYIILTVLVALSLIMIVGKFGKALMTKFGVAEEQVNTKIEIQQ